MEREVSTVTMLSVVMIALAAVIAIAFGSFQIAKAKANTGSTDANTKLNVISEKEYSDYDNKIVLGQYAIEAIRNFERRNIAVLVATTSLKDCYNSSANLIVSNGEDLAGVKDAYTISGSNLNNFTRNVVRITDGSYKTNNSSIKMNGVFINYNTLLGPGSFGSLTGSTNKKVTYNSDISKFVCSTGFVASDTNKEIYAKNSVTKNLTRTGMVEYIPVAAKFNSYLIVDGGGAVIGVALDQIN